MLLECGADVRPRGVTGQHEVVQPAEQAERVVPGKVGRERADPRVVRKPAAEIGVERRAAVAVRGLPLEDLLLTRVGRARYFAAARADLACSTISLNLPGSVAARSASTFRSSSTFAIFKPDMNWLYERPFARAPALMRMIQSFRNSRFRTFRSRYAYARERSTCSFA